MATVEKPLHVQVAEALGWTKLVDTHGHLLLPGEPNMWLGTPPPLDLNHYRYISAIDAKERILTMNCGSVPRYDTDWSVTGPLIEERGFSVEPFIHGGWRAVRPSQDPEGHLERRGRTPLIAVCNLIITLYAAGKL